MSFSSAHQQAPFNDFQQEIKYTYNAGVLQMPVAGKLDGTQACEVIQIHSPISQKLVAWRSERYGSMPVIPDPTPGSNEVLASTIVSPETPPLGADGNNRLITISGVYVVHFSVPVTVQSGSMYMGSSPVDNSQGQYIGTQNIQQTLH